MNIREARDAIEAILAAIDDDELPEFDKAELGDDGKVCVWWSSTGHYLGSARSGGVRNPLNYRSGASWSAIEAEMTCRADQRFLANGDKPDGLRLAKKVVTR